MTTSTTNTPKQAASVPSTTRRLPFCEFSGIDIFTVAEGTPVADALEHASYFLALANSLLTCDPEELGSDQVFTCRHMIEMAKGLVDASESGWQRVATDGPGESTEGTGDSVGANARGPEQAQAPATPESPKAEAEGLVCECAISTGAIYRLADRLYDECLATNNDAAMMAVIIKDSAARIESRLERAIELMEGMA